MSISEVAPKTIELDSLKPYGTYSWYPNSEWGSSSSWESSVGELYGCVCHRAFDEPARSLVESTRAGELELAARTLKKQLDPRSACEASADAVTRI
jgi:hypothetical protein